MSTSAATAGLDLVADHDLVVRDDPDAFGAAVAGLLDEPARAAVMAARGRAHVRDLLDPARNLERLAALLAPTAPPAAGAG